MDHARPCRDSEWTCWCSRKEPLGWCMYYIYIWNNYIHVYIYICRKCFQRFGKLLAGLGWWGVCINQACGSTLKFGPKFVQRNRRLKQRFFLPSLHIPSFILSHPHIFVTWHHVGCANTLCSPSTRWLFETWKRITSRRIKTHYYFSGKMLIIVGLMIRHFQRCRCLICNLTWFSSRRSKPHVFLPSLASLPRMPCLASRKRLSASAQIWKVDSERDEMEKSLIYNILLVGGFK